jgi:hypothetical protein
MMAERDLDDQLATGAPIDAVGCELNHRRCLPRLVQQLRSFAP